MASFGVIRRPRPELKTPMPILKRYSKRRSAGDQTSGGRGKLLKATTKLSRVELVVRETIQNSWDARDDAWYPAYGVRVYRLEPDSREVLRERVFTDLPESLADLKESLLTPEVHAIEIYDRGTSGLDGPFRAEVEAEEGEPNNFNSFVFDIGTTKESETSGGTYGFGKTATFEVSRPHSVVYWSRCWNSDGELEYRLIAASLHEPYAEDGARYTGAHWWGDPSDDEIVPLRGDEAEKLGESLFRTHFGEDETGTSILIIDPVISVAADDEAALERTPVRSEEHLDQLLAQISDALSSSAWPKTIPAEGNNPPMNIELYRNGDEQNVAAQIRERNVRFADSLVQVRTEQGTQSPDSPWERPPNIVREQTYSIALRPGKSMKANREEFFGSRKDNVVGHLHMAVSVGGPSLKGNGAHGNTLCLMRSNAELVVRYEYVDESDDDILQWHGVFKPTPECDRHFASTEPSTHDSWTPSAAESEISNYVVSKALQHIKGKARKFLSENQSVQSDGQSSVRKVATALRSFVPFGELTSEDGAVADAKSARRAASKAKTTDTNVDVVHAAPLPEGRGQVLTIRPTSSSHDRLSVSVAVYAKTSDGRIALLEEELAIEWFADGKKLSREHFCTIQSGSTAQLTLRTRVAAALEVDLHAEEVA